MEALGSRIGTLKCPLHQFTLPMEQHICPPLPGNPLSPRTHHHHHPHLPALHQWEQEPLSWEQGQPHRAGAGLCWPCSLVSSWQHQLKVPLLSGMGWKGQQPISKSPGLLCQLCSCTGHHHGARWALRNCSGGLGTGNSSSLVVQCWFSFLSAASTVFSFSRALWMLLGALLPSAVIHCLSLPAFPQIL